MVWVMEAIKPTAETIYFGPFQEILFAYLFNKHVFDASLVPGTTLSTKKIR